MLTVSIVSHRQGGLAQRVLDDLSGMDSRIAHVIVTRMQQSGLDAELAAEARASLETANVLTPGDRRFGLLSSALDKLEASGKAS